MLSFCQADLVNHNMVFHSQLCCLISVFSVWISFCCWCSDSGAHAVASRRVSAPHWSCSIHPRPVEVDPRLELCQATRVCHVWIPRHRTIVYFAAWSFSSFPHCSHLYVRATQETQTETSESGGTSWEFGLGRWGDRRIPQRVDRAQPVCFQTVTVDGRMWKPCVNFHGVSLNRLMVM